MEFITMKATPVASPSRAEAMGYDAAINKPNTTNCHFSCFATKELMKAWERGNKRGKAELQSRKNEQ